MRVTTTGGRSERGGWKMCLGKGVLGMIYPTGQIIADQHLNYRIFSLGP